MENTEFKVTVCELPSSVINVHVSSGEFQSCIMVDDSSFVGQALVDIGVMMKEHFEKEV